MQLVLNRIHCKKCNTDIISRSVYDRVVCGCDNHASTDGGTDYMKVSAVDMNLVEFTPIYIEDGVEKFRYAKIFSRQARLVSAADMSKKSIKYDLEYYYNEGTQSDQLYITVLKAELRYKIGLEREKKINKIIE